MPLRGPNSTNMDDMYKSHTRTRLARVIEHIRVFLEGQEVNYVEKYSIYHHISAQWTSPRKDLITWLLGSYWNSYMPCRMHDANPNNSLLILSPDDIFWFSLFCSVFFSSLEPTSTLSYIYVYNLIELCVCSRVM